MQAEPMNLVLFPVLAALVVVVVLMVVSAVVVVVVRWSDGDRAARPARPAPGFWMVLAGWLLGFLGVIVLGALVPPTRAKIDLYPFPNDWSRLDAALAVGGALLGALVVLTFARLAWINRRRLAESIRYAHESAPLATPTLPHAPAPPAPPAAPSPRSASDPHLPATRDGQPVGIHPFAIVLGVLVLAALGVVMLRPFFLLFPVNPVRPPREYFTPILLLAGYATLVVGFVQLARYGVPGLLGTNRALAGATLLGAVALAAALGSLAVGLGVVPGAERRGPLWYGLSGIVVICGASGVGLLIRGLTRPAAPTGEPSTPAAPRECPECGRPIAPGAPAGLCPRCLLGGALPSESRLSPTLPHGPFEPPPVEEVARLVPHLKVERLIGAGGMGAVYLARQPALDRPVALKLIRPRADDPAFAERFAREAKAMARLGHPNVVAVYESGESAGQPYLVMEFVDGVTLRDAMRERRLSPAEALAVVPQVCDALAYAHAQGVVHRDVKPENILLARDGRVKIADFGLAKLAEADVSLTGTRQAMGTPHYMAPEQWEKPAAVDHRADIYALGVVLYELLTGELPLGRFDPPSHKVQVDVRLDGVVLRALAKEPERRYQHASDVKTDLEEIRSGAGGKRVT